VRVFLYVACVLDGECLASLTELQGLVDELGSATLENMRWTAGLLSRAATMWPLLPNIPRPLAELMSLGVGFIPVVGDLYDLVSGLTGYDPITGERLPEWARAVAIGAAFVPLVSASGLRYADDALGYADEALDFEQDVGRFIRRGCSFSAETQVATSEGAQAIAQVEVGEHVLAYDEATGATGYFTVTATLVHLDPVVVYLTLDDETIETTPEHPFYVIESAPWLTPWKVVGHWVAAGELEVGDPVRRSDGSTGVVQAVVIVAQPRAMYNLTVADAHSFFVGEQQWLVHNACIVDYGEIVGALKRRTGMIAELSSSLPMGTEAIKSIIPPGFDQLPTDNRARGHLLARLLGGSGSEPENLVALYQNPVNNKVMRSVERQIRRAVDAGETVIYQAIPIYKETELAPIGVTIEAVGSKGLEIALSILNRLP
jgi:hypothetical protein